MDKFTNAELNDLLKSLTLQYAELELENDELREIAQNALIGMKKNRELLEESQRVTEYLLELVRKHIDSKFTLDDVPKRPS